MPTVPALGAIVALLLCHRMPAHGLKLTTRAQVDEVASFDTDAVSAARPGQRRAGFTHPRSYLVVAAQRPQCHTRA